MPPLARPRIPSRKYGWTTKKIVLLLDSTAAAQAITTDRYDHYFEQSLVTASEMSIQMKKPLKGGESRADLLPAYREFLKSDVATLAMPNQNLWPK